MATRWRLLGRDLVAYRPIVAPRCGCVYVIYLDNELVYIGSTNNMFSRITRHVITQSFETHQIATPWGNGTRLTIKYKKSRRFGDWLMDEVRLIRRLRPRGNRAILRSR